MGIHVPDITIFLRWVQFLCIDTDLPLRFDFTPRAYSYTDYETAGRYGRVGIGQELSGY